LKLRSRAASYTHNHNLRAFKATGVWLWNSLKVFKYQLPNCTQLKIWPSSPFAAQINISQKPSTVSRLVHSILHLVTEQTHSSPTLKSLIGYFERSAQGTLADKELCKEMVRFLRSGAKNIHATAANDQFHLGKTFVYMAEDVVELREDRQTI
jgi:hypothetical protein